MRPGGIGTARGGLPTPVLPDNRSYPVTLKPPSARHSNVVAGVIVGVIAAAGRVLRIGAGELAEQVGRVAGCAPAASRAGERRGEARYVRASGSG